MNRSSLALMTAILFAGGLAKTDTQALYDEKADARQQIGAALARASKTGKRVVLVFGANW